MPPDFVIPRSYNVTFKDLSTNPISVRELADQARNLELDEFETIIGLGGRDYRAVIEQVFMPMDLRPIFPFSGLPIGMAMGAAKQAIRDGKAF